MEKENNIGALWVKQGQKGQYMSGYVEINGVQIRLICFTNQYKKEDKHPDWNILLSKPRDNQAVVQEQNNETLSDQQLNELDSIPF